MPQQQRHLPPIEDWAGRQKARAALASATRLMSESDRASFAGYDVEFVVEFVVEISRCRAPLHRSTTHAVRPAADVELYSAIALYSSTALHRSTLYILYILYTLPQELTPAPGREREQRWQPPMTVDRHDEPTAMQRQRMPRGGPAAELRRAAQQRHRRTGEHGTRRHRSQGGRVESDATAPSRQRGP